MSMFGQNIALLREINELNQTEFSEILCIHRASIWQYEKSELLPNAETVMKIADTFHVSMDWLMGRDTTKDIIPNVKTIKEAKRLKRIEELKKELAELEEKE
jgi:transcriptional regulator with XRE-family HTH domain